VLEHVADAGSLLDDLEENLSVFDTKLRHMREDIAAIEARNNRLELQTRNNSKLLAALEGSFGA
jgi:exocyst complex component 1